MTHLTAQEAAAITIAKRKNKDEVFKAISAMANSGLDYACISINEIRYPEEQKEYWEGLGYKIELSTNHFKINW